MKVAFAFALILMILLSGCSGQQAAKENTSAASVGNQAPTTAGVNASPGGNLSPTNPSPVGNTTSENTTASPSNEVVIVQTPPQPAGPVQPISVAMKDYAFNPANITVKKGTIVRLTLTSLDRAYGFAIKGYNINEMVTGGNSSVVTFTADKTGIFEIKDSYVTSGAAYNMVGSLTVTG